MPVIQVGSRVNVQAKLKVSDLVSNGGKFGRTFLYATGFVNCGAGTAGS
jgi:hypothetical protein